MPSRIFIFLFCSFLSAVSYAQSYGVDGSVADTNNKGIDMSAIILSQKHDLTTKTIATVYSDDKGYFKFSRLGKGSYILTVQQLGYVRQMIPITISDTFVHLNKIILKQTYAALDEVVITAQSVRQFSDKTEYRLSASDIAAKSTGLEALCVVPRVLLNGNKKIELVGGASVKILLNGINATEADLALIASSDIQRIDFYENPPARYALLGLGAVVDVITKSNKRGGSINASLLNSLKFPWGSDDMGVRYSYKDTQFGIRFHDGYRDFKHNRSDEYLSYSFDGKNYIKDKIGVDAPWTIRMKDIQMDVVNEKENNYTFSAQLMLGTLDNQPVSIQNTKEYSPNQQNLVSHSKVNEQFKKPVLDLYFDKKIGDRQDLSLNAIGTFYKTNYYSDYQELRQDEETNFFSSTNIKGNKSSVIADLVYSYNLKKQCLSVGVRTMYANSVQDVFVVDNEHLTSASNEIYGYVEAKGSLGSKLSYSASLGMSHDGSRSTELNKYYSYLYFRPILNLTYSYNNHSSYQFSYQVATTNPTLGELSENPVMKDEHFAISGNAGLVPFYTHQLKLSYSYSSNHFYLSSELLFNYLQHPIMPSFVAKPNYLLQTYLNLKNSQHFSWDASLKWYPLSSKCLEIAIYGRAFKDRTVGPDFSWSHFDYQLMPSLTFTKKKWSMSALYETSTKQINGQILTKLPSYAYVELGYKPMENLTAKLGWRYPFFKSLSDETLTDVSALVSQRKIESTYDFANMVYLNLTYNFSFGSRIKSVKKKIHNSDNDSGLL